MQPMKPAEVHRILNERPDVSLEHIHEYQQLRGDWQRFNAKRNLSPEESEKHQALLARINDLHEKLYGKRPNG